MILAVYPVFFACYTVNKTQKQGVCICTSSAGGLGVECYTDPLSTMLAQIADGHPIPDSEAEMNHSLEEKCPSGTWPTKTLSWLKQDIARTITNL
jgi:hypothetical protein